VLPFTPATSKDHSALYVYLAGLHPRYHTVRPTRQKVIRPDARSSGYLNALRRSEGRFAAMLRAWQAGSVPVESALQHFLDLLVSCASGEGSAGGPVSPAATGTRTRPWYDERCKALADALNQAWSVWHASRGGLYGSLDSCPVARAALQEARRAYKACCKQKKREHQMRCQVELLETFFGTEQKDFWRVFFADRRPYTALSDVSAWTTYFAELLGTAPAPLSLAPGDADLKQQLYSVSVYDSLLCPPRAPRRICRI